MPSAGILEDGIDWFKMIIIGYTETSPTESTNLRCVKFQQSSDRLSSCSVAK